jgi:phosphate transport system permease protein
VATEVWDDRPVRPKAHPTGPDRVFRGLSTTAALTSLVIVGLTLVFLIDKARPALAKAGVVNFFTKSVWSPAAAHFGVLGLLVGTVTIALIALVVGAPSGVCMALFINEYAPVWLRRPVTTVIDLLAALPSILFGMWGVAALQGKLVPVAKWLTSHLSILPPFRLSAQAADLTGSSFVIGVVVGIMILPIITSVSRDVMSQVPREQCEGALALGGTRWGMIRDVILPFGRSGIVGATLLGFGRALGETIAVALIINLRFRANSHVLSSGGGSIASLIAIRFGEAGPLEQSGLVAAGLALFVLTLVVNLAARSVVARSARMT